MHYINQPVEQGVILKRHSSIPGDISTNVPWNIKYHSPTGFEWGYGGSGPADLALNLAELVVQKAELNTIQDAHCSALAWNAKHTVKTLLIVYVPEEGAFIPWKLVCYAVLDACDEKNREKLQKYIDKLSGGN